MQNITKALNPFQRYWKFVTSKNFKHAKPYLTDNTVASIDV